MEEKTLAERAPGDLAAEHRRSFEARFGAAGGLRVFFAPGRVNLMGAHLDYNGGPVMPTAIDRGTFVAVRPRRDRTIRLASTLERGALETTLDELPVEPAGAWFDYPLGVLRRLVDRGASLGGLELFFGGNLPVGAGLSSSASICVGTALALDEVHGLGGSLHDHIDAALWAEREFVGVHCGIMDPYAVGLARPGHLLWLDCKDASTEHVPLDAERFSIAVADTGVRRELAQGAFNERVDECARAFAALRRYVPEATCLRDVPAALVEERAEELEPALLQRARHVTSEVERAFASRAALHAGDHAAFGRAISASHASLRDRFDVSIPELDVLVEAALEWDGVLGARLTGAGFGGCVVVLLERRGRPGLVEHLGAAFGERFGRPPTVEFFHGDGGPREL